MGLVRDRYVSKYRGGVSTGSFAEVLAIAGYIIDYVRIAPSSDRAAFAGDGFRDRSAKSRLGRQDVWGGRIAK